MARSLLACILVFWFGTAGAADAPARSMTVGDGLIDGRKLTAYEYTWQQCGFADGEWVPSAPLRETLATVGEHVLRLRHIVPQPGGATTVASTYFERHSFAPLRMEMEAIIPDGTRKPLSVRELDKKGYRGWSALSGEVKPVQGKINSQMLHGGAMGLPLATLDYQETPVKFEASMMSFDGTYDVVATWAGKETLEHKGRKIQAWMIDVEWLHRESGDVYPAGPDASGGRYWVVPEPPEGFPYVPRYKTDTYAVEFLPINCPPPADAD